MQPMTTKRTPMQNERTHTDLSPRHTLMRTSLWAFALMVLTLPVVGYWLPMWSAAGTSYYEIKMSDPTKAGKVELVAKQKNTITGTKWTTTVSIDVTADMTAEEKMQALVDELNASTPVAGTSFGQPVLGATFVANPGHISVAPSSDDNPFTDLRISDDGTGQDIDSKKVTDISAPPGLSDGTVVFFGEPLGSNPGGGPSYIYLGTQRYSARIQIEPGDTWETVTAALLLELGLQGVSVTSPANGVFLLRLNRVDDQHSLRAGSDDVGLEFSIGLR